MIPKKRLFVISFAEGAAVMAAEISGAKLLAPFFGSSLYVWSSVMAVTLGGLACGYFIGGRMSTKAQKEQKLLLILIGAISCLCLMPFMSGLFYFTASYLPLIPSVILSVFVLLFPTMLCMGATSPLIISILTTSAGESGINSGKIYAISTVGGIVATFACGFYLIPYVGVKLTLICFATVLALACLLLITKKEMKLFPVMLLPLLCVIIYSFKNTTRHSFIIYETEGMLGKLEIREEPLFKDPSVMIRKLLINTIIQTEMNVDTKASVSDYVSLLKQNSSYFPEGKALVFGLGGGLVSNMLAQQHYQVTGVEFDERIIEMAKRFFYLDPSVKTICDDARHYLNSCHQTYNLILFDVFKAEEQPSHIITSESLAKLKTIMDTNALVLINTHGYLTGEKGQGTQCLLATLKQSGFYVKVCASGNTEAYRNLVIVAGLHPFTTVWNDEISIPGTSTSFVNKDDQPVIELLNAPANKEWRSNYIRNYILGSE